MIFSDVVNQGFVFAACFFCGAVSGIYYEIICSLRVLIKAGKAVNVLLDFIFCLLSAATFFLIMFTVNGIDLKWYVFAGLLCGFAVERFSLRKLFALITAKVYNITVKIKQKLSKIIFNRRKNKEGV